MATHVVLHLHNVPVGREDDYAVWFEGPHHAALSALDGNLSADRYEVTPEQVMADIPQPWRYLSVYDVTSQDLEAAIAGLSQRLAQARSDGLIEHDGAERTYGYRLGSDWRGSGNWRQDMAFSGLSILLGNITPGRETDYETWYDDIHRHEVTGVPGNVAMRRGVLADLTIEHGGYCPGDQLVMCAQQTDDLAFTIKDFVDRALGQSPSGVAMQPRSDAASTARTVHYFRKIGTGPTWPGGIAYAGDAEGYPGRRFVA